jgi:branched-chain amino acid transport system substrate-binding protein
MVKFKWVAAGLIGLSLAGASLAQQGPVTIVGLMELSGTGATAGTNFDNGVKLAVKEINAAGGILGRKIEYTTMDTQSAPQTAKALAQKAVDQSAYIVMGPVFSGSFIVSMAETKRAEIPNFTGGEAANITQQGNPYVFRTSFTQSTAMPKLARYIKDTVKAKSVAMIWVNNDFGKGGRDSMAKALEAQGIKVAADISIRARSISRLRSSRRSSRTRMRSSSIRTRRSRRGLCAS